MSRRNRLEDVIFGRLPDSVPVIPFVMKYSAKIAGISYRDYCTSSKGMAESQLKCLERFGYDATNVSSDPHRLAGALGGKIRFPEEGVPVVEEPPIKSREDLRTTQIPDPKDDPRCRQRLKAIEIIKNRNPQIPVIGWVEGALSEASSIIGPINALRAIKKDPEFMEDLYRFCAKFDTEFALAQVEAGADIIGAGDSLASQISTENFRESVVYSQEIFDDLSVPTLYHVCGDTTHQLEVLARSGADIIDLDWQVDLKQARKVLGPETVIRGNINPTKFVRAEPDDIASLSRTAIETAGAEGSFILSAGCEIPPDSREENLEKMIEIARGYQY